MEITTTVVIMIEFLSVNDIVPFIHLPEGRHRPKQEDTSSTFASFKSDGGGGGSRAGSDSDNSDDARIIQNKYLEKDLTTKGGDTATAGVSGKDHNDTLGDLQRKRNTTAKAEPARSINCLCYRSEQCIYIHQKNLRRLCR